MTTRAVDAVLWDFGGVFTVSPFESVGGYAEGLGTTPMRLAEVVFGYDEPDGDHPWHQLERGEIPLHEGLDGVRAITEAAGLAGFELTAFFRSLVSSAGEEDRNAVVELGRELRAAGLAQGLVTNNIAEFGEGWRRQAPMELFTVVVDSSAVGMRKPDPAIYRLALAELGDPDPARVAFVDDYAPNVAAAADVGLRAVWMHGDPRAALDEVRRLSGLLRSG